MAEGGGGGGRFAWKSRQVEQTAFSLGLFVSGQPLESSAHSEVDSSPEANHLWKYVTDTAGVGLLADSKTYEPEGHNQPSHRFV